MPRSAVLRELLATLSHSGRLQVHIQDVAPEALHFLAALLAEQTGRRVALVTNDSGRAYRLYDELKHLLARGFDCADVMLLPPSNVSPYIEVSVDSRRQQQALGALARLASGRAGRVLVVPAAELSTRIVPPGTLAAAVGTLEVGEEVDRQQFIESLVNAGYVRVSSVMEPGTFAVRGSLMDLFSPGEREPVRIDFFGDEVESIAKFIPETQVTSRKVSAAHVYPATPAVELSGLHSRARKKLMDLADDLDLPSSQLGDFMESLRQRELPAGSEALLPLLAGGGVPLTDYLPPDDWLFLFEDLAEVKMAVQARTEAADAHYEVCRQRGRLALPPSDLFLSSTELEKRLKAFCRVNAGPLDTAANYRYSLPMTRPLDDPPDGDSRLASFGRKAAALARSGYHVYLTAPDEREVRRAAALVKGHGVPIRLRRTDLAYRELVGGQAAGAIRAYLSGLESGVECSDLGLYLVTTNDLFARERNLRTTDAPPVSQEKLFQLEEGDHVVHRDYGIGRFEGVERKKMGAGEHTSLKIVYAKQDTLYVPVHNAGVVQKYVGSGQASPRLDRLGGASWNKRVQKVKKEARKLAIDLLKLYARRQAVAGFAFSPGDDYFSEFEASFPYQETPDQAKAAEEVLADMEKSTPMDRLVCGDVGFGKTEVAIRAAFKTVLDGKQVAVLVPTTVLAEQHRLTFADRLKAYPVTVESVSRFKSKAAQSEVLKRLKAGRIDIVIGTHRLLSGDVEFKELGLMVVDEEHRFGVGHKEKLKALRAEVDVLSMTATPIPRTLHMAMSGIRDLSVIKTPPPGRLAIETHLVHFDPVVLRNAIETELGRGGQLFFLHNRVQDILTVKEQLELLVPGVRIGVAHGQMKETQLEKAMIRFMEGDHDLLLCTTIIESGLDLPNVNTLVVNNAHSFGLAQLYQIRGRVGRASRQAYAYFIVPPTETMATDARSRLATLAKFTAVGSGFQVAAIDMELRGAGDLLGASQSGHIAAVGFDMYVHLLHEEVDVLKSEHEAAAPVECQVELPVEVHLPEEYVPDRHQRLVFYRMAASARDLAALERLRFEMRDRFGPFPKPVSQLLAVAELRVRGASLGVSRVEVKGRVVRLNLSQCPDRVLDGVLELVKKQPAPIKVLPENVLSADLARHGAPDPVARVRRVLNYIERAVDGR